MKIFISHVTADEALASVLKEYLESIFLNATVFVSSTDLKGGQVWIERLREALHEADAVIAVITPRSLTSKWVYFEAGAGFTSKRTIPVVDGGLSFDQVGPPLSFLQARHLDTAGLESLARDVARLGNVRDPVRFPTLDAALQKIGELTSALAKSTQLTVQPPTRSSDTQATDLDRVLLSLQTEVNALARSTLISAIKKQGASFDVPSDQELATTSLLEVMQLADAVGASTDRIDMQILILVNQSVPTLNDPAWKKAKFRKDIEGIRSVLTEYKSRSV